MLQVARKGEQFKLTVRLADNLQPDGQSRVGLAAGKRDYRQGGRRDRTTDRQPAIILRVRDAIAIARIALLHRVSRDDRRWADQ